MARMKMEVAKKAAQHSLEAHILYQTEVQCRDVAESLEVAGEHALAEAAQDLASRILARRKRIME